MSALASTSRVQMRRIKETVFGVTPTTGNPANMRMTGESLDFTLSKDTSKEIRADRQLSGSTTTDAMSGGDINIHMQYAEYDTELQALFMSSYAVLGANGETTSFSAAYTANTITAGAAPTGPSALTNLQLGQFFRVSHPANPNNGKVLRVSSSVAPTATAITLDASTPAIVSAGGAGATVQASRLTNGVTESSFTYEKWLGDVGQFFAYRGQYIAKMALKFASASLLEGSFTLMGKDAVRTTATTLPGIPTASKTFEIQNAVRGVGQLWEGGVPLTTTFIKSLDFTVDNNLRNQGAVGNLGPVGIGTGDFSVSGSVSIYFSATGGASIYDKFLSDTYTALTFSDQDAAGNGYIWTLPRVMLKTGKVVAGSKNADFMAEFTFEAYADDTNAVPALRQTLFLDRVGVPIV